MTACCASLSLSLSMRASVPARDGPDLRPGPPFVRYSTMEDSTTSHRIRKALLVALVIVIGLPAVLATALAVVDGNRLRGPIAGYLSKRYGRQIRIEGELRTHLLSLHPAFVAERVTIGNPPWIPPGAMA